MDDVSITLVWQRGDTSARWTYDGREIVWNSSEPLRSAAFVVEPTSIVLVEAPSVGGISNAVVLNLDGSERIRLEPPEARSPIGFDQVFQSRAGVVAVFATRNGDLQGEPDLQSGKLTNVREWR